VNVKIVVQKSYKLFTEIREQKGPLDTRKEGSFCFDNGTILNFVVYFSYTFLNIKLEF
jgi:hypothetical protein